LSPATRPLVILVVLTIASAVQHAWYWRHLPDRVATYLGIDGQPNDWMTRTSATVTLCGIQIGMPLLLVAVTWLAGVTIARFDDEHSQQRVLAAS
jgi:uncharacterized membrane protein